MSLQTTSPEFRTLTVTRATSKDTYPAGLLIFGTSSTVSVVGSVTPATGDDMKRLPDAARTSEAMRIIADDELRTMNTLTGFAADLVDLDGEQWEILSVKTWPSYAPKQRHWDAIAARLDRDGAAA